MAWGEVLHSLLGKMDIFGQVLFSEEGGSCEPTKHGSEKGTIDVFVLKTRSSHGVPPVSTLPRELMRNANSLALFQNC